MKANVNSIPSLASPATDFADEFTALLSVWNQHQALRSEGAPLDQLFESRATLDASRLSAARLATAS